MANNRQAAANAQTFAACRILADHGFVVCRLHMCHSQSETAGRFHAIRLAHHLSYAVLCAHMQSDNLRVQLRKLNLKVSMSKDICARWCWKVACQCVGSW